MSIVIFHIHSFIRNVFFVISANKSKVYYGIPPEPDLGVVIEEESEEDDDKDKPKVYTELFKAGFH